jgi:hypothetical protein
MSMRDRALFQERVCGILLCLVLIGPSLFSMNTHQREHINFKEIAVNCEFNQVSDDTSNHRNNSNHHLKIVTTYLGLHSLITPNWGSNKNKFPMSNFAIDYENYFFKDLRGKNCFLFGLGITYRKSIVYGDSSTYKLVNLHLDLVHRINFGQDFFFKLGISPILNNTTLIKSRLSNTHQVWKKYSYLNNKFNSAFEIGFGFNISKKCEIQLNYLNNPNPILSEKISNDFIEFGLILKL